MILLAAEQGLVAAEIAPIVRQDQETVRRWFARYRRTAAAKVVAHCGEVGCECAPDAVPRMKIIREAVYEDRLRIRSAYLRVEVDTRSRTNDRLHTCQGS